MAPSTTTKDPASSSQSHSASRPSSKPPLSSPSSLFSCGYTCGLEEPFETIKNMRRASLSRRQQAFDSPPVRSRSQERFGNDTAAREVVLDHQDVSLADTDDDAALDTDVDESSREMAVQDMKEIGSSSNSKRGVHDRSMSDPFDTQEWKDAIQEVQDDDAFDEALVKSIPTLTTKQVYPTLLRYPVTASRNKNCWSEPPVHIFSVRGPNYFQNKNKKKKVTSGPYLLTARGTDIFLFDKPVLLEERSHLILGGHLRSRPTLLINFKFPWGVMVLYFEVPATLAPYLNDPSTPLVASLTHSERTLAKWFKGDKEYKNDRLKLIPYVAEGPWVVRNMVTGRPAIIGRKLPVRYRTLPGKGADAPLCECTLDIGSSSATAKRIVSVCRRYMSGLTSDIGFVIQAESPDELPEQMLGAMRVHGPDPLKAPKIA